jgi:hypothetical protein
MKFSNICARAVPSGYSTGPTSGAGSNRALGSAKPAKLCGGGS